MTALSRSRRMVFLTPTWLPAGGVVKILDYATYARAMGFSVDLHGPDPFSPELPVFAIERFASLADDPGTTFHQGYQIGLDQGDYCFFSWPAHAEFVLPVIGPWHDPRQVLLIVQNVRWANPRFVEGRAIRVLAAPMVRIAVTHEVADAIEPLVDRTIPTRVIVEGHDWPYFSKERSGGAGRPLRVGYTTWKSQVGVAVEERLGGEPGFEFRSIRTTATWPVIRELYHWCDVFLGCPFAEEGFYLAGLEAMAAGCLVVMPDVGGNRSYADFGVNCLQVPFEDTDAYAAALRQLVDAGDEEIEKMRSAGYAVLANHTLEREQEEFAALVAELDAQLGV